VLLWRPGPGKTAHRFDWPPAPVAGGSLELGHNNSQKHQSIHPSLQNLVRKHRLPASSPSQLHPSLTQVVISTASVFELAAYWHRLMTAFVLSSTTLEASRVSNSTCIVLAYRISAGDKQ
jgi:hypothetical protein